MGKYTNEFKQAIQDIIAEFYEGPVDLEERFEEAGINSVTFVKIAVSIENEYSVEFKDQDFEEDRFGNIEEFIQYVYDMYNSKKEN